jgi:NADP-reducing hydrogenase subunit HndB
MTKLAEMKKIKRNTLKDLKKVRRVQVGVGTCGIAAGAREVYEFFEREKDKHKLEDCMITGVGCMGECALEPMVEVVDKDGTSMIYCNVSVDRAQEIVDQHLLKGLKLEKYSLTRQKK